MLKVHSEQSFTKTLYRRNLIWPHYKPANVKVYRPRPTCSVHADTSGELLQPLHTLPCLVPWDFVPGTLFPFPAGAFWHHAANARHCLTLNLSWYVFAKNHNIMPRPWSKQYARDLALHQVLADSDWMKWKVYFGSVRVDLPVNWSVVSKVFKIHFCFLLAGMTRRQPGPRDRVSSGQCQLRGGPKVDSEAQNQGVMCKRNELTKTNKQTNKNS